MICPVEILVAQAGIGLSRDPRRCASEHNKSGETKNPAAS